MNVQADLNLCRAHMFKGTFSDVAAPFTYGSVHNTQQEKCALTPNANREDPDQTVDLFIDILYLSIGSVTGNEGSDQTARIHG